MVIRDPWVGSLLLTFALTVLFGVLRHRDHSELAECRARADADAVQAAEQIHAINRELLMCIVDSRTAPVVKL